MTITTNYLIEPLAPLVFRSGKPFGSIASAADVVFPMPSAAAGLIRATSIHQQHAHIDEHKINNIDDQSYQQVLSIQSKGPYLVRFDDSYKHIEMLVPKPADALYFEVKPDEHADARVQVLRLSPKALDADCGSDLPEGLLPVQMQKPTKGKPKPGVAYWTLDHLKKWQNQSELTFDELQQDGVAQLPIEVRTHVAIDNQTQATQTGKLFQTASFDFGYTKVADTQTASQSTWQTHRLGFVIQSEQRLNEDTVTFGGERRLSKFLPINDIDAFYDHGLDELLNKINDANGFRLTFLTPCIFKNGYLPAWIDNNTKQGTLPDTNTTVTLKACAIDRWQPVSGWDSIVWKPKAMRKAVSSGSVYWFDLNDSLSSTELEHILHLVWSDDHQDKKDGFGSAIIAPWQASTS